MQHGNYNDGTLVTRAEALSRKARSDVERRQALVGDKQREEHLAATFHLRRAAVAGSVDNRIYNHGSAEQALGGLDICPLAMLGFKAAGALLYPQLLSAAEHLPDGTLIDHVRDVLRDPMVRRYCIELGAYHRFQWKLSVYQQEQARWDAKAIAHDPLAKWRRRKATAKQRYLVEIISGCLAARGDAFTFPNLDLRGETHDWLQKAGGNPLFWHPPLLPVVPHPRYGGTGND